MKNKYLDRSIHTLAMYVTLCTTEKQFQAELKRLNMPLDKWPGWMGSARSSACTTLLEQGGGKRHVVIVSVRPPEPGEGADGIDIAAWLAHEAVHVWQYHLGIVGDKESHSMEFEAYAIENIFKNLAREYARQVA